MTNANFFQSFQPWIETTTTTANKFFNLNAKAFENISKIQMGLVSEFANTIGKCSQDFTNPKDFGSMPTKLTNELNTFTQKAVEQNQKTLETVIDTANQYRQLSQQYGQEVSDFVTTNCGGEAKATSTGAKKVA